MRLTTSFALASGILLAGSVAAAAWPALTRSNANVRGGPGAGYSMLGTLPAGSPVEVVSCTAAWCQTQYGYVSASLLSQASGAAASAYAGQPQAGHTLNDYSALSAIGGTGAVAAAMAGEAGTTHPGEATTMAGPRTTIGITNVRSGPGTEYEVVKTLPDFSKVEVTGCGNGWCQTNEGYISIYLLSRGPVQQVLTQQAQSRLPGSQTRDSIAWNAGAQVAMNYAVPGAALPYAAAQAVPSYAGTGMTTANANVRSGPGRRYGLLGILPAGTPVNVVSCTGAWCRTQYGYVSARLVRQGWGGYRSGATVGNAVPVAAGPSLGVPAAVAPAAPAIAGAAALGYAAPAGTSDGQPAAAGVSTQSGMPLPVQQPASRAYAPGVGTQMTALPGAASGGGIGGYGATTTAAVNVRSGPGSTYGLLGTLPAGTPVNVVSCSGAWCQTQQGYVSARHLSTGVQPLAARPASTRVVVRPSRAAAGGYSGVAYVDPAYASYADGYPAGYVAEPGYGGYGGYGYSPAPDLGGAVLATLAAPIVGVAAAVDTVVGGWTGNWYGARSYGYGWGPGYWGPGVWGANRPSYWGARPGYWGGRPTYSSMNPGYTGYARFGDRNGDTYWSRRGEGRAPQRVSVYYGLGPRWQGPYDAGPWYDGRPVMWRPRVSRW